MHHPKTHAGALAALQHMDHALVGWGSLIHIRGVIDQPEDTDQPLNRGCQDHNNQGLVELVQTMVSHRIKSHECQERAEGFDQDAGDTEGEAQGIHGLLGSAEVDAGFIHE